LKAEDAEIEGENREAEILENEKKAVEDAVQQAVDIQETIRKAKIKQKKKDQEAKTVVGEAITGVEHEIEEKIEEPKIPQPNVPPESAVQANINNVGGVNLGGSTTVTGTLTINGQSIKGYVGPEIIEQLKHGIIPNPIKTVLLMDISDRIGKQGLHVNPQQIQELKKSNTARELFEVIRTIFHQAGIGEEMHKVKQELYQLVKDEQVIAQFEQEIDQLEKEEAEQEHTINQLEIQEDTLQSRKENVEAQATLAVEAGAQSEYLTDAARELEVLARMQSKDGTISAKKAEQLRKLDMLEQLERAA
jgi:hypothetical protein